MIVGGANIAIGGYISCAGANINATSTQRMTVHHLTDVGLCDDVAAALVRMDAAGQGAWRCHHAQRRSVDGVPPLRLAVTRRGN